MPTFSFHSIPHSQQAHSQQAHRESPFQAFARCRRKKRVAHLANMPDTWPTNVWGLLSYLLSLTPTKLRPCHLPCQSLLCNCHHQFQPAQHHHCSKATIHIPPTLSSGPVCARAGGSAFFFAYNGLKVILGAAVYAFSLLHCVALRHQSRCVATHTHTAVHRPAVQPKNVRWDHGTTTNTVTDNIEANQQVHLAFKSDTQAHSDITIPLHAHTNSHSQLGLASQPVSFITAMFTQHMC